MSLGSLGGLVPMVRVEDVARSIESYRPLGFVMRNKLESEGRLVWAWLDSGRAYLMVSRSQGPMTPGVRNVILYLYASDLVAYRNRLAADGIKVGPIDIEDPDRYCVLVVQTDEVSF